MSLRAALATSQIPGLVMRKVVASPTSHPGLGLATNSQGKTWVSPVVGGIIGTGGMVALAAWLGKKHPNHLGYIALGGGVLGALSGYFLWSSGNA